MGWNALLAPFGDAYERKARGAPALLTILPLLVLLCCARGIDRPVPTVLLALLSAGGGITAIAAVGRALGKGLEQRMIRRWGGLATTRLLRHRDGHYSRYSLEHIHERLHNLTGLVMPTPADERADPADADARYAAATERLRQKTRGEKFPHLRRENIAYGFYRNALALKPLGLLACLLCGLGGVILSGAPHTHPWGISWEHLIAPGVGAAIALIVAVAMALIWSCLTKAGLKRVATAYAERLFECLDNLSGAGRARKPKGEAHES
jgi:hypothetical protein